MNSRRARRRSSRAAAALVLGLLLAGTSCGKKGPPLPPFVRLPAAVERITAARLGSDVYLTFTLPSANVDRSTPIDLAYVDVYAVTAMAPPPRAMFVQQAMAIARIPVSAPPAGPPPASSDPAAAAPGATVTVLDARAAPSQQGLRRFYLAVPFSARGRAGAQHTPVEVAFMPVAPAPPPPQLELTPAGTLNVSWPALPPAPGAMPRRMNVYRVPPVAPDAAASPWRAAVPMPANTMPLTAAPFSEPVTMGVEVCYVLREVTGAGAMAAPGEASPPACLTPVDRFPPAPPAGLVAVAGGNGITLLWEANAEPDLAGYLVLRGAPGDARLQPLTMMPTAETRYIDTTAATGMRYVYAVVAVDTAAPTPNTSAESARVEETAR